MKWEKIAWLKEADRIYQEDIALRRRLSDCSKQVDELKTRFLLD